jgi:hypothetical protein
MDCKTVTSSPIKNALERSESSISVIFLFQRIFFVVRTFVHLRRETILLDVTIFEGTEEFVSVLGPSKAGIPVLKLVLKFFVEYIIKQNKKISPKILSLLRNFFN